MSGPHSVTGHGKMWWFFSIENLWEMNGLWIIDNNYNTNILLVSTIPNLTRNRITIAVGKLNTVRYPVTRVSQESKPSLWHHPTKSPKRNPWTLESLPLKQKMPSPISNLNYIPMCYIPIICFTLYHVIPCYTHKPHPCYTGGFPRPSRHFVRILRIHAVAGNFSCHAEYQGLDLCHADAGGLGLT